MTVTVKEAKEIMRQHGYRGFSSFLFYGLTREQVENFAKSLDDVHTKHQEDK